MIVKVLKDTHVGTCTRYTIGKPGGVVSGALYIQDGHFAPEDFCFVFPEKESRSEAMSEVHNKNYGPSKEAQDA